MENASQRIGTKIILWLLGQINKNESDPFCNYCKNKSYEGREIWLCSVQSRELIDIIPQMKKKTLSFRLEKKLLYLECAFETTLLFFSFSFSFCRQNFSVTDTFKVLSSQLCRFNEKTSILFPKENSNYIFLFRSRCFFVFFQFYLERGRFKVY